MNPKTKHEFLTFAGQRIAGAKKILKVYNNQHSPSQAMRDLATSEGLMKRAYELVMKDIKS